MLLSMNGFSYFGEQCQSRNHDLYFMNQHYLYPNNNSESQFDNIIAVPVDKNGTGYVAGLLMMSFRHLYRQVPVFITM